MKVSVAIPCYKVKSHILKVIEDIGPEVDRIYVVDDCCPDESGRFVEIEVKDDRVKVIFHEQNQGVGGAVCSGYRAALAEGMDIVIKIDGDGQMNPRLIPKFIKPIIEGRADYAKGSRFYSLDSLDAMPSMRKFGNAVLSFVNKVSSGYWNIMDPTNGFTAIHHSSLAMLPLDKLSKRYFFESDMLFRLGTLRAVVRDIPMTSKYEDEESGLSIVKVACEFPLKYLKAFIKRILYTYYLRDFNGASMEMVIGVMLMTFGSVFGGMHWTASVLSHEAATTGTVMLSALPIILGFQLMLSAITFDMNNVPKEPLSELV